MLSNHKQCLLDIINFQTAEHSKGGQSLKRAVVAQKNYVTSIHMFIASLLTNTLMKTKERVRRVTRAEFMHVAILEM
jgi:hypothetical protein